jgi:magnesium transporter
MDPDVVQVQAAQTVATALEAIRSYVRKVELDEFFSIFVVNEARQLVGVVPTGRMLLAEPHQQVGEIMIPDPLAVEAHMDQEEVSRLVIDHDLVTVPVVDGQRRLIGRITVDDVVDVIQEEYEEDLGHLTGTEGEPVREFSLLQTLRVRVPWLFVAFVGEFGSAMIIRSREEFLLLVPQLAFFIPVIMAMGGNAGIQSSSLVIRGLATGEVRLSHFGSRLLREISISLCIGLIFALILVSGGAALTGIYKLGLAIGLAMMANISLASVIGIAIPMVLKRLGQDPALATGPFLTTMNDMVGILIYLVVAHAILF